MASVEAAPRYSYLRGAGVAQSQPERGYAFGYALEGRRAPLRALQVPFLLIESIVIVAVLICLILLRAFCYWRCRRKKKTEREKLKG